MYRRLRPAKFFIIHFGALKGQSLIAAAAMATVRMSMAEENVKNIFVIEHQVIFNQESKKKYLTHDEIDESELPTGFDHESKILAHSSSLNIENKLVAIPIESNHLSPRTLDFGPDWDLQLTENWPEEDPILISNITFNVNFEKPDSVLKEKENWRNKGKTDDVLIKV